MRGSRLVMREGLIMRQTSNTCDLRGMRVFWKVCSSRSNFNFCISFTVGNLWSVLLMSLQILLALICYGGRYSPYQT